MATDTEEPVIADDPHDEVPDDELAIDDLLERLGRLKRGQKTEVRELAARIKRALPRARAADLPVADVADKLGIHRTTVYRVYDKRDE